MSNVFWVHNKIQSQPSYNVLRGDLPHTLSTHRCRGLGKHCKMKTIWMYIKWKWWCYSGKHSSTNQTTFNQKLKCDMPGLCPTSTIWFITTDHCNASSLHSAYVTWLRCEYKYLAISSEWLCGIANAIHLACCSTVWSLGSVEDMRRG